MAGDRQHSLPRFLMKGFASRTEGKKVFTWLYRKGASAREVSTKDVAVGRLFYETPDETADPEITAGETGFGALVTQLREGPLGTPLPSEGIPELVAHLVTRSKHFRDSLEEMGDEALAQFQEFIAKPGALLRLIGSNPTANEEMKQRVLDNLSETLSPEEMVRAQYEINANWLRILKEGLRKDGPIFQAILFDVFSKVREKIPEMVKAHHVKTLQANLAPELRVQQFENLTWVMHQARSPLVLGDVVALVEVNENRRFKPYGEAGDSLIGVYLPIAPDRLLVGRPVGEARQVDLKSFRAEYIGACREFFITEKRSRDLETASGLLGSKSRILSKEEIESSFREAISG